MFGTSSWECAARQVACMIFSILFGHWCIWQPWFSRIEERCLGPDPPQLSGHDLARAAWTAGWAIVGLWIGAHIPL